MQCPHKEINADGESVCVLCGLVMETIYAPSSFPAQSPEDDCKTVDEDIYTFIRDVYSRGNIAESTLQQSFRTYARMSKKSHRREKKRQLACFAIYATLSEANVPRSLREIEHLSGIQTMKLWRIEKKEKSTVLDCSENFVARICSTLNLPYKDECAIKSIVARISGISGCRASTLIGAIIWLYINDTICSCASLQEICRACDVTCSSVRKFIKKINPLYRDNINVLLGSNK